MIDYITHSDSSTKTMSYIGKEEAHSQRYTKTRNLVCGGQNLANDYQGHFNWLYSAMQMLATRELAGKADKPKQAHHLIISFSEKDFPKVTGDDLQKQAQQAYELVDGYLKERFPPTAQYALAIQRDGKGGYLHAHVCLNSVNFDGKTLSTDLFDKFKLDKSLNDYFNKHFEDVTGRKFEPVKPTKEKSNGDYWNKKHKEEDAKKGKKPYIWKDDLRERIDLALRISVNSDEFFANLKKQGVDAGESNTTIDGKRKKSFTYSFIDENEQFQTIRAYRVRRGKAIGLGKQYMYDPIMEQLAENKAAHIDYVDTPHELPKTQPLPAFQAPTYHVPTTPAPKPTQATTEPTVHFVDAVPPQTQPVQATTPVQNLSKEKATKRRRKRFKQAQQTRIRRKHIRGSQDTSLRDSVKPIPNAPKKNDDRQLGF